MLKVSSLFILLCGLIASSSAQEVLSRVSSQITDALTQGLLGMNFLPTLQTIDFQGPLKDIFSLVLGHQLTNGEANFMVQMKDLRLFQVFIETSPDFKGIDLRMPLAFSIQIKFPALNPYIFHVRTDMKVQLYLEKDVDNRYQLTFGHCRIVPETVWIQSGNFITPMKNFIVENIERALGNVIIHNFGAKMCPFINSWLYNLNPQVTNQLISLLLQHGTYQATVEISAK
ncbi:latherin-like [Lynx canadensis]|uniref:latherin-like n=1 Tax=Lynx canadensis TaxID=61383 RepID=UPI0011B01FF4|nr:latherin-like [Lynx canadensis]